VEPTLFEKTSMKLVNKYNLKSSVSAFTILEVVIVLSIMSVLITIVAISTNRFQEQLKETTKIQDELNQFYAIRSQLWYEFYTSDSIQTEPNYLHLFTGEESVSYFIEHDTLYRKKEEQVKSLHIAMQGIESSLFEEQRKVALIFNWKDAPLRLEYVQPGGLKNKIDTYFEQYKR
jgi:type II secretory pathway pseudopilin PulG